MSVELGRRLLFSGAVGASEIQAALFRHLGTGTPFVRALLDVGAMSERGLEEELSRATTPPLPSVVPLAGLVDQLPSDLCRRLMCVPIRQDPRTGTVDVAVVDPFDGHAASEISFHLKADVRPLRGTLSAIEQALTRIDKGEFSSKVILRKSTPPPADISSSRPPSGPPIPLVRRSSRRIGAAKGAEGEGIETLGVRDIVESVETLGAPDIVETVEVLGVRDIVEQMEGDGGITDELGQPIMQLRTSRVPRAPGMPTFGAAPPDREGPPATSRGPFSPRAPVAPFADIDGVLAGFQKAQTRDEVVDGLIVGMSTVARRVGAFAVKKRGFRGIACNADLGEAKVFREIEIPTDAPTVLGIATSKGTYLGPLPATPPHEALLRFMDGSSGEVAAVLVSIAGRPAVVLFADALGDTMIATKRAEQLGREASIAFSRILTEAKGERRSGA